MFLNRFVAIIIMSFMPLFDRVLIERCAPEIRNQKSQRVLSEKECAVATLNKNIY